MIDLFTRNSALKLNHIARFNGMKFIGKPENVTEHSFWVTFGANFIAEKLFGEKCISLGLDIWYYKFFRLLIKKAMLHDYDETITGDVIFTTKHHASAGEGIQNELDKIIQQEIEILKNNGDMVAAEYFSCVMCVNFEGESTINDVLANCIVKICDWLSCYSICHQQVELNNSCFKNISSLCLKKLHQKLVELRKLCEDYTLSFDEDFFKQFFIQINRHRIQYGYH